jgi:hypothetical protein
VEVERFLVRCKRTHRLGLVDLIVHPARPGGRDLFVLWQGGIDYSLMSRDEVDLERDTPIEHWERLPPNRWDHPVDNCD